VLGFMGGMPIAGVIWQHLHYIVGLQRLGHDVYYCEDSARIAYNPETTNHDVDWSYVPKTLDRLARRFGFPDRWGYCARFLPDQPTAGLDRARMRDLIRSADAALNVCGAQEIHEELQGAANLIYVESDPGLEQIRIDSGHPGSREYFDRHRALFTFGEDVGSARFPVPLHGYRWLPTRQPVVTDFWATEAPPPPGAVFRTIANWNTSGLKDAHWRGETYLWSKSLEFLRFIEAPERAGEAIEMATEIRDAAIRARFAAHGWRLVDPRPLSDDIDQYVAYVRGSRGEFTVAKDQYVRLRTGWFSDRSACYLAAGRPVITQETGFTRHYGAGRGLLAFSTIEEIAEAARAIRADYAAHCRAASAIAVEHFEATRVLASLLERAGV
ncbi:MAG TPA: hypothetical protein VFF36_14725, partial [Planctomycetota bacterium]|nr:hypothetical protein [Planctomycetota bacterium]